MTTFEGRVALVTGGASGMGLQSARLLARNGANVHLADIRTDAVEAAAKELSADGEVTGHTLDITDRQGCTSLVQRVEADHGAVDILVNCAGMAMSFTPVDEVDPDLYRRIMTVNVDGTFWLCQAVIPGMRTRGRGSIVNFASAVVTRPRPGLSPYVAAKAAVIGLTRTMAIELAEHGVRVNCILPGATDTPMLPQFVGADADMAAARQVYESSIPMGQLAQPEDIARGVLYLSSDAASFVTGETLAIDGGRGI
ncbi:MAG: SDR family NAD(P)-dependent oxidoreductase [Stackebrandtia sp.]